MCGKKEYFSYFDESFRESKKLGNNTSMVVSGKGNIPLQVSGITQIITDRGILCSKTEEQFVE